MNVWQTKALGDNHENQISVFSKFLSEVYDNSWYGHVDESEIEFFVSFAMNKRVLEIGSGTGRVTLPLLQAGCDLYGIEGSHEMYTTLQSRLEASHLPRFVLWDARCTPYPVNDETFGLIIIPFSTFGLIHNNVEELGENRLMHEFYRILQANGELIINDYRIRSFQEEYGKKPFSTTTSYHEHHLHGRVTEIQESSFKEIPNRLLPHQKIRERRIKFIRESDGHVIEEHFEAVPLWYPEDYKILGHDAGFEYSKGVERQFHKRPSVSHIFRKA